MKKREARDVEAFRRGREISLAAHAFFFFFFSFSRKVTFFFLPFSYRAVPSKTPKNFKNSRSGTGSRPGRARLGKRGGASVIFWRKGGEKGREKIVRGTSFSAKQIAFRVFFDTRSPLSASRLSFSLFASACTAVEQAGAIDYAEREKERGKRK